MKEFSKDYANFLKCLFLPGHHYPTGCILLLSQSYHFVLTRALVEQNLKDINHTPPLCNKALSLSNPQW